MSLSTSTRIAVITPSYNEEARIALWIESVFTAVKALKSKNISFEVVIVDDGSQDKTSDVVLNSVREQGHPELPVTLIKLAHNSGHNVALTTGIDFVRESVDAIITLDADGEHPALLISQLIEAWKEQPCVVHTVRRKNSQLPFLKTLFSQLFYSSIRIFSGLPIASGMADFKLWDTRLLKNYRKPLHRYGPTRLLAVALSPQGPRIAFDQIVVENRTSRFSNRKMMDLALSSFVFFNRLNFKNVALFSSLAFCGFWFLPPDTFARSWGISVFAIATLLSFGLFGFIQSFKNRASQFSVDGKLLLVRSEVPTPLQQ